MTIIANGSNNQFSKYRKFSKYGANNNYGDGISGIRTDGSVTMLDIVSNCDTAVQFDGTDWMATPSSEAFNMGTGDFTVEAWINLDNFDSDAGAQPTIFGNGGGGYQQQVYVSNAGKVIAGNTGSTYMESGATLVAGNWYHIAVTRSSGTGRLFVNGIQEDTETSWTTDLGGTTYYIGAFDDGTNGKIEGFISNVRIIKGQALYTSNFTPPTKPLTAITNTVLLTCQGNTIADASSSAHTITANGDISLTKEPFGGAGAVSFDGSGDALQIPNTTETNFGIGDFTIESWIKTGSTASPAVIIQDYGSPGSANGWIFRQDATNNNKLELIVFDGSDSNGYKVTGTSIITDNTWHHVAATREGTTIKVFVDGVQEASATNSFNITSTQDAYIGMHYNGAFPFNGHISNLRVVKGTALYTSNFTPPSRTLEPIENTVLLTCQGQNIKDASSNAHTITVNGDAKATIVSSSFEFDGSNDYITTNTNANFTLGASEDFALEWWEYWTLTSPTTMHGHVGVFDNGCLHIASYTGNQQFAMHYGTWRYFANAYVVPSQWTHYVVTGQSQNIRFYQNGELKSTNTGSVYTVSGTPGATKYFEVGRSTYVSPGYSKMKVSSVKFYKGKALSTEEVTQNYNATKGRYA